MPAVPSTWAWDGGQPSFSVQLAAVATNNLDGTFATPVRVPSTKAVLTNIKMLSDQAQGDTSITALASQIISADVTIDFAGITQAAYQVITGIAPTSSSTPTRRYMTFANNRMPYFGLFLESLAAESAGDTLIFLPKLKIMGDFSWKWEYGKIITPQIKATAIADLILGYVIQQVERDVVAAMTMPPA